MNSDEFYDELTRKIYGSKKVKFEYVGDRSDPEHLLCQYQFEGKTYRFRYQTILEMSDILNSVPQEVRKDIIHWCDMIHNPD